MRLAMIENIPLPVDLFDAAVRGACMVEAVALAPAPIAHVAVGDDDPAVCEVPVGIPARGIAELVIVHGRIDEIIGITDPADGCALVEPVSEEAVSLNGRFRHPALKGRAARIGRQDALGPFGHGEHIVLKRTADGAHHAARLLFDLFHALAEHPRLHPPHGGAQQTGELIEGIPRSVVKADDAAVVDDRGIEGHKAGAERAVGKADMAQKLKFAVGRIAYGHPHRAKVAALPLVPAQTIVEIVAPVLSLHAVGRIEIGTARLFRERILRGAVACAPAAPVGEIVNGRRPHLVVEHTEGLAALLIVRAVEIDPITKDVRLAVRDVGIKR